MSARRKTSIDEPGFMGYLGGGQWKPVEPQPLGSPMRAMFEFLPHNEDCPPGCYKCKPPRRKRSGP